MIPYDFEYYQPTTISETIQTIETLTEQGKHYIFYNGGTEFITFARMNDLQVDAVIDIKKIPECNRLSMQHNHLVIGAATTLNQIANANYFPLLSDVVKRIADHTSRNKITIGGNINSRLIYREGILPLLLTEAKLKLNGKDGETEIPLEKVFNQTLTIDRDQFLTQILIDDAFLQCPYFTIKKTRLTKVGYPIVSIAAMTYNNTTRIALSGVCDYPFRSTEIESLFNDHSISATDRIDRIVQHLPSPIVEDIQGSAAYREFVLRNVLDETMEALGVK